MVLQERYSTLSNGKLSFYLNRALRIYPIHFAVLSIYICTHLYSGQPLFLLGDWTGQDIGLKAHAVFSNLFLFGVEIIPMIDFENWQLVLGPTWSLSLELYFYLLAPFVVLCRLRWLIVIAIGAFLLRIGLLLSDLPMVNWRYFFFPADIVFFLLGAISYRVSKCSLLEKMKKKKLPQAIAALTIVACTTYPPLWSVGGLDSINAWVFYCCVSLCIPFLFELTKNWKIDRFLGHLAYPVYLSHMAVVSVIAQNNLFSNNDKGLAVLIVTLILSIFLYTAIEVPIEKIRQHVKQRGLLTAFYSKPNHLADLKHRRGVINQLDEAAFILPDQRKGKIAPK
jgi:peptidoglycan/LPS O-acetylase OafA/YrhL